MIFSDGFAKIERVSNTTKTFGGAQEGSGRPKKGGVRSQFLLSLRGRAILQAAAREGGTQMTPALEAILRDYASRHNLKVEEQELEEEGE